MPKVPKTPEVACLYAHTYIHNQCTFLLKDDDMLCIYNRQ